MGLDVSMYRLHVENDGVASRLDEEIHERRAAAWKEITKGREYDDLSKEEKDEARALADQRTRDFLDAADIPVFNDEGDHPLFADYGVEPVQDDSSKYPDHMFKIGYMRSSYNDGGINRVLDRTLSHEIPGIEDGLWWIFQAWEDREQLYVTPDWEASRKRARQALDALQEYDNRYGRFDVITESEGVFTPNDPKTSSESEALAHFRKEMEGAATFDTYSNAKGLFFRNPENAPKIRAIMMGEDTILSQKRPCAYVVVEYDESHLEWYIKALEIVVEMCDWVLNQEDPTRYCLSWSY